MRATWGAATLVPFWATMEPLRDPALKTPYRTGESSLIALASGPVRLAGDLSRVGVIGPAEE